MDEYACTEATELAQLVRNGSVSAAELVEAAIRRVDRLNDTLGAVTVSRFDAARKEAAHAEGPFAGVPYMIKDHTP